MRSKFIGSLIGTAIGDTLGAFSEGWVGVHPTQVEFVADNQSILCYTDDTHMMIGVAESLVMKQGFDAEHMANVFVQNYQEEPYRGYGPGPPRIFKLIGLGEPWDKAAETIYPGGSYGNGSAMRIAPVGVLYWDQPDELFRVAHESSRITHSHELGKEGAALEAHAIALATSMDASEPFDAKQFLDKLGTTVQHKVYQQRLADMRALLYQRDMANIVSSLGHGIEAFNSVPAAIYSFLIHPHSFEESVLYAISLGGDTDTIGAMNGAISGAYLGISSIPQKWELKLENREYIENLANKLWTIYSNRHKSH
ncbi:MAG: ADP-ribosylglycohydrolase family protein [Chloroflexota bacterium]|nr:ADP-ribosylglycohydrolase family protein [Chloroflexota bacterium]